MRSKRTETLEHDITLDLTSAQEERSEATEHLCASVSKDLLDCITHIIATSYESKKARNLA